MLTRLVGRGWVGDGDCEDVVVRAEASDTDEVAIHLKGHPAGDVSLYVSREEACLLGVLVIAAAHSAPA